MLLWAPAWEHPLANLQSSSVCRLHVFNVNTPDWTFLYDLEGQLQFPIEAAVTSLRPDVVLFSRSSKTIVLLELTVPLEDNVHQAHDRKTSKYSAFVTAC